MIYARRFYTDQKRRNCKFCNRLIMVNKSGELREHKREQHPEGETFFYTLVRCKGSRTKANE